MLSTGSNPIVCPRDPSHTMIITMTLSLLNPDNYRAGLALDPEQVIQEDDIVIFASNITFPSVKVFNVNVNKLFYSFNSQSC